MSWQESTLGDILDLKYGKGLPERSRIPGDVPVYGSSGITGFHNEPLISGPGIIVGRKGTIGSVYLENKDFFPIDTVYYVEENRSKVGLRFTYYLLKTLHLNKLNTDAAVPGLNRNNALRVKCKIPSLNKQEQIVNILSAYDDLIENNRRRIQLLEESARLLYREWFVRFRFPGHEHVKIVDGVPQGWERVKLGEKVVLNYGKALKADDRIEGPYPVYGSSGIVGYHNKPLVQGPGIIVGRKGNVGSTYWSYKGYCPIDTVYFIDKETSNLYLLYTLKNMQFISSDAAVPGLNRDYAYSREINIPSKAILKLFIGAITPIHEQIYKLDEYNEKLKEARDILLPRLMNGEIAV